MRNSKSYKFKNYGPIPQNEYTTTNLARSADDAAVLRYAPNPDDTAYKQRLIKRQTQHPSGRRKIRGWSRSWKANGWRAESAALYDEITGIGRYYGYVQKSSRPL